MQPGGGGEGLRSGALYGQEGGQAHGAFLPVRGGGGRGGPGGRGAGHGEGGRLPGGMLRGQRRGQPAGHGAGVRQAFRERPLQGGPSVRAADDIQHGGGQCEHRLRPERQEPECGHGLRHGHQFHRGGLPLHPVRGDGRLRGRGNRGGGMPDRNRRVCRAERSVRQHGSPEVLHPL